MTVGDEELMRCFRVEGRVQGVGFRYWTRGQARALGLRGWVRNLPDGAVEVVAAGPSVAVTSLEALLRQGPSAARVEAVHGRVGSADLPVEDFEIRR